jgi:hypothetical protein
MRRTRSGTAVKACFLQVGSDLVAVYGDDESGWSLEAGIDMTRIPLYRTIDELYFALVNMNVSSEGRA